VNRRQFLLASAGVLCAGGRALALDAKDRLIVPGQRVGALLKSTPPRDIAKIFGAAAVKYGKVPMAEGQEAPGAFVHKGTADELQVGFTAKSRRIEYITIVGRNWRTADGIRIGTTLAELERINGGPFTLSGFDWDYGGIVQTKAPGKLPRFLSISTRTVNSQAVPPNEYTQISGDRQISSRHPVLAKVGVVVIRLSMAWPE
jgi:hypothetical protein